MSKETDQALTMISIVAGAMEVLKLEKPFAKVEIQRAIETTWKAAGFAINAWPIRKNWYWIQDKFKEFKEVVEPSWT